MPSKVIVFCPLVDFKNKPAMLMTISPHGYYELRIDMAGGKTFKRDQKRRKEMARKLKQEEKLRKKMERREAKKQDGDTDEAASPEIDRSTIL